MTNNPVNDIARIYLEQIAESAVPGKPSERLGAVTAIPKDERDAARERTLAKAKAMREKRAKRWWDDDDDGIGYEPGEVSGKFVRKESKETPKRWWDDDDDGIGYEPGEVSGKFKKKKKVTKEGFSNWREDLIEIVDKIKKDKSEDVKIVEKDINNKVDINPKLDLGERVENLGGTLLEMSEIENFEGVFDELSESEIFLLSDELIEQVVEEVFYECLEEGYNIQEVENTLLESLEISSSLLTEAEVTYGHDTKIKKDRLERVKSAVKKVGKGIAHGTGYVAGAAVRGAKAIGRELKSGYQRGRRGDSGGTSGGGSDSTGTTQSSSDSKSSTEKKPGLLSRIASKLKRGLVKVARAVSRGARNVARRLSDKDTTSSSTSGQSKVTQGHRSKVTHGRGEESKTEPKQPKVTSKTTKVSSDESEAKPPKPPKPARRFGSSSSYTASGEEAYQAAKQELENRGLKKANPATKSAAKPKSKSAAKPKAKSKTENPQKPGLPSLDDLLKKESYQLSEMSVSKDQQELFGLALSVKRGETPRSEVSAEVLKIVDTMSEKKIRDFAKTKHEGLPKKVQTKEENDLKSSQLDEFLGTGKVAAPLTTGGQTKQYHQQKVLGINIGKPTPVPAGKEYNPKTVQNYNTLNPTRSLVRNPNTNQLQSVAKPSKPPAAKPSIGQQARQGLESSRRRLELEIQ